MRNKILFFAIIAVFVMFTVSCSNKSGGGSSDQKDSAKSESSETKSDSKGKRYDMKSGIVSYTAEVMGMKQVQKLYFDDYGDKEMKESIVEMEIMGFKSKTVSVELTKDGYIYKYDLEKITNNKNEAKKEVMKMKMPSISSADMKTMAAAMSDDMKKQYDYKEEGTETVAGVTGNKFSMKIGQERMVGVLYKRVMLKTQMKIMTMTADKFEENASIPEDKFELPKDYTVVEMK